MYHIWDFQFIKEKPSFKDKLEMYVEGVHINGTGIVNIELLILSYPWAEDFKDMISPLISASETVARNK